MTLDSSITDPAATPRPTRFDFAEVAYLTLGIALSLIVGGYQFGFGNHTVYLLDALRHLDPQVLTNDWFTTNTLQYHAIFTAFTALLMRLGVVEPAFLVGYLLLVTLWHLGWRAWSRAMGLSRETYLLSVILYLMSAGGISIGVYRFMQDSCFLPSNISNIAMLWGLYFWCCSKRLASAACLGLAGMFHINHAAAVCIVWGLLVLWDAATTTSRGRLLLRRQCTGSSFPSSDPEDNADKSDTRSGFLRFLRRVLTRKNILTTLIAVVPSLLNIGNALLQKTRGNGGSIPLPDFIDIYVHVRHAHHFDPLSWPLALWISFLWPMPLAAIALIRAIRTESDPARNNLFVQTGRVSGILFMLMLISLVFAGIWFVSETLVQLIFYRFTIYLKLLSCLGAAAVLLHWRPSFATSTRVTVFAIPLVLTLFVLWLSERPPADGLALRTIQTSVQLHRIAYLALSGMLLFAALLLLPSMHLRTTRHVACVIAAAIILTTLWSRLGLGMTPERDDPEYRAVCDWARGETPVDATFLVPPDETMFRLYARRAIVANFKSIPQLSDEFIEWQARLQQILGTHDLRSLPRQYDRIMSHLRDTYESLPPSHHDLTGERYRARYVVLGHSVTTPANWTLVYTSPKRSYFVYDRGP